MTKIRNLTAAASLTFAAFSFAGTASAQDCSSGFIAGTLCDMGVISPEVARGADQVNHALGRPVDNTIYNGMDAMVPGSGTVARAYSNRQRGGRGDRGAPQQNYAPQRSPAPQGYGAPQNYGNQGYPPQTYSPQPGYGQPSMTFRCNTPMGPAIVNQPMVPGAACWVGTANGVVWGIAGF
jgi:hypothetical protein